MAGAGAGDSLLSLQFFEKSIAKKMRLKPIGFSFGTSAEANGNRKEKDLNCELRS